MAKLWIISHLYKESRSVCLANIRAFSDDRVRHALDTKETREAGWTRKFSSSVYAKKIFDTVLPNFPAPTLPPNLPLPPAPPPLPISSRSADSTDPALDMSRESLFSEQLRHL